MPVRIQPICRAIIFTSAIIMAVVGTGFCDIYKYIDENGVMHFTNVPTASSVKYRVYIREAPAVSPDSTTSSPYHDLIIRAAEKHGISVPLLKAIIKAESNFNPKAVSKKGAMGLMQIMPQNVKALNIHDPFDPRENIMGGTRYFKRLVNRFDGKISLAIAAYNAGPVAVERHQRIPPFRETQDYVKRVLKYYNAYKKG